MFSSNIFSVSGNISTCSYVSDESIGDKVLEENGRISLAYENLRNIPRRIAEKLSAHTKVLDLSYNDFHNLSFLSFFEDLDTLILDHNNNLDVKTLPVLPELKIFWINNCNISNIADWVHRIKLKCPCIEQLSIMGNPGLIKDLNCHTTSNHYSMESLIPSTVVKDNREYMLNVLPSLKYLDGIPRHALQPIKFTSNNRSTSVSFSSGTNLRLYNSFSSTESSKIRTSPHISFTDLFSNRRKKSGRSSSTN